MEECEASYTASMTPAVTALMMTETVESCDSADGWWVSSTLNSLSGYDADTMSVCQMDGEYMIQMDGMIYPTCVAYGAPDAECSDSDLICPENPNNVGVFGYAGNQRSALASALTRNDFMHPVCPTSTCKSMDELADSGSYWKGVLMNNGFTDVAEDEADNVCVTEDNTVMFITTEGKYNTCLGWSATGTETCDSQKFICAGHDGQGLFTYGWPGQIARTLAKAVTSDSYMHPQCPLMICSA